MKAIERGFLLLTSHLGDPDRKPLTMAQFRTLTERVRTGRRTDAERDLCCSDLINLGYSRCLAERILRLLGDEELLHHYLNRGERGGCIPITRVSEEYPLLLRKRLGIDSPGCLWARGDLSLLDTPTVSLVGSRNVDTLNSDFAAEVGRQAALQGYTLVSGNARGSDTAAQNACLKAGGKVISVLADSLLAHRVRENVLYLSEDGFDEEFSAQRALSRNRVIHGLGLKTFVAQTGMKTGGTWDGTVKNLQSGWSRVYGCRDGSEGMALLEQMGAELITAEDLHSFYDLPEPELNLFDR